MDLLQTKLDLLHTGPVVWSQSKDEVTPKKRSVPLECLHQWGVHDSHMRIPALLSLPSFRGCESFPRGLRY